MFRMTQIPDSAKRKIDEAADKARGGRASDIYTVAAEFGYRLAKSETTDRHELKEWKTSHPYFVTGSLVSDAEVKAYEAGKASKS